MNRSSSKVSAIQKSFHQFDSRAYLNEYYSHLGEENRELMKFYERSYADVFNHIKKARVLEFGGGPTIYQLISLAKYDVSIDFSDYLEQNVKEVQRWLKNDPKMFSWDTFIKYALKLEEISQSENNIIRRADLIRKKVKRLLHCDARKPNPIKGIANKQYDMVSVNFVPESITQKKQEWYILIDHIISLVESTGYLVMTAIVGAKQYRVGHLFFPATPVTSEVIMNELNRKGFTTIHTHFVSAEQKETQGYEGLFMILAKKS